LDPEFVETMNQNFDQLYNYGIRDGSSRVWINGIPLNIWDIDETNVYR